MPRFLVISPIAACVAFNAMTLWLTKRVWVRVTLDVAAGNLLVITSSGQVSLPMAEVARAEFARDDSGESSPVYRLEFAMKDGKRIPATSIFVNAYGADHRAKAVEVINAALGRGACRSS